MAVPTASKDVPLSPQGGEGRGEGRSLLLLTAIVLAARALAYPFTQNWYGDAFSRIELGEEWAASPHWMRGFGDGAWQFGPLHLYLLGAFSKLGLPREHAGRVLSLLFGVATTVPVYFLSRRLFGQRAARVSCGVLAFWGLHVQFSTTAASEALALFLFATTFACFAAATWSGVLGAAAALTLACATRYDAWLLLPLLTAVLLARKQWSRAGAFALIGGAFPAVWMLGNLQLHGDALYPLHYIDDFHRTWVAQNDAFWGVWRHRALNLVFWPAVALFTLTPPVAIAGFIGARRHWRRCGWLIAVLLVPTALFTFRGAVLGDFVPLGRFAGRELLVLAVLAGPVLRPRAVVVLAAFTLLFGAWTWHREGPWTSSLRPLSPVTTLPQTVRAAIDEAKQCDGTVWLAADPGFHDLAVAFYSGRPVLLERHGRSRVEAKCAIERF